MSPELVELLLKAVRSLSQEEQDQVLRELISAGAELAPARLSVPLPADPVPTMTMFGFQRQNTARLREALAGEGGGPWQTVPVRLPHEQHDRLKQWCQANNFTMAVVLRGLVTRFLDEYGPPRTDEAGRAEPARAAARRPAAAHRGGDISTSRSMPQSLAGRLKAPFSVVAGTTRRYPHLGITLCIVIAT